jgi:LPXTG-motif cell wall-anchored protein
MDLIELGIMGFVLILLLVLHIYKKRKQRI